MLGMSGVTWKEVPAMILLSLCGLWALEWLRQYERDNAPVAEYFEVSQLAVPNHVVGQNPVIGYERVIPRDFHGEWRGEVQDLATGQAVCDNNGNWQYETTSIMPVGGFTLDWFMSKQCHLPVGTYRLQSCWDVHRERARMVTYCRTTDPFTVFDPQTLIQQGEDQ